MFEFVTSTVTRYKYGIKTLFDIIFGGYFRLLKNLQHVWGVWKTLFEKQIIKTIATQQKFEKHVGGCLFTVAFVVIIKFTKISLKLNNNSNLYTLFINK